MKHKVVFTKARKLIDERELDGTNLERAEEALEQLVAKDAACAWAFGLLAEICYWRGENVPAKQKLTYFERGVGYGEHGVAADEDSLEANFWLAVNYGFYGSEKGAMQSLALVSPLKRCAERALEIDESYFYGGPWRILGRLYHKAPGWPLSVGDKRKAVECLENALQFGENFFLNRLFLAEAYLARGDKDGAREHLKWLIKTPLSKNHEREDAAIKREAKALLKTIG